MPGPSREELAARIAEIEASGAHAAPAGPRRGADPKPVKATKRAKTLGRGTSSVGSAPASAAAGRQERADRPAPPAAPSAFGHAKPVKQVRPKAQLGRTKPEAGRGSADAEAAEPVAPSAYGHAKPVKQVRAKAQLGQSKPGSRRPSKPKPTRVAPDDSEPGAAVGHAKPVKQPRLVDESAGSEPSASSGSGGRRDRRSRSTRGSRGASSGVVESLPEAPTYAASWADLPPPPDVPLLADAAAAVAPDDGAAAPPEPELTGQAAMDAERAEYPVLAPRVRKARKQQVAQLAFSDVTPHQHAIDLAYVLVSQRERTVAQIREKLAAKDCSAEAIDAAVQELLRLGFVDDRRYARMYAEDKRRLQSWGARRIRLQLGRAGIDRAVLDQLFADEEAELDAPSEFDACLELLRRRRVDPADPKARNRAAAMLARRGIASPTVYAALREHAVREAADPD